jgi:hydroxymethylbilane synthase
VVLKIGTRGSKLALAQSLWVKRQVEIRYPRARVEMVKIKTTGDKVLDAPLARIGGKGLFVKEIEDALLRGQIHVAVHSIKDVPAELPEDLILSAFPEREDPRDALISIGNEPLHQLPKGSRIGTSSLRRIAQALHLRPDFEMVPLRGNVDTRMKKLESGDLQGIILARAGVRRLHLDDQISQVIPIAQMVPAIGQGALGLEVRRHDEKTLDLIRFLNHEPTEVAVRAERALLKELEGGCQVPVAGLGVLDGGHLTLEGMVAELDGSTVIRDRITGEKAAAEKIGVTLARKLLDAGARQILARIYGKT